MKEMKANNNAIELLNAALSHLQEAKKLLEEVDLEEKPKKATIEIRIKNPFTEEADLEDEEIEKLRKELEEIINDATRE